MKNYNSHFIKSIAQKFNFCFKSSSADELWIISRKISCGVECDKKTTFHLRTLKVLSFTNKVRSGRNVKLSLSARGNNNETIITRGNWKLFKMMKRERRKIFIHIHYVNVTMSLEPLEECHKVIKNHKS